MRELFHGWRRKMGAVTLLMACAFAGLWVRSTVVIDVFTISYEQRRYQWRTSDYGISGIYFELMGDLSFSVLPRDFWRRMVVDDFNVDRDDVPNWPDDVLKWRKRLVGFELGEHFDPTFMRAQYMVIPYWALVTPLTLLSAYLLLSKPRPTSKQQVTHA